MANRKPATFNIEHAVYQELKVIAAKKKVRLYQLIEDIFVDFLRKEYGE